MIKFKNADEAFAYYKKQIPQWGVDFDDTKALFNIGFEMSDPTSRLITDERRDWKQEYAEAEWQWYLSGDNNIEKLGDIYGKVPEIWKRMANQWGYVNSNYGWQWQRVDNGISQYDRIVNMLKENPKTRQAAISIYDGKEHIGGLSSRCDYKHDTPCTYAIQFTILNGLLNMCITMRSNDLWYGFCNDQYCFSKLQSLVAHELDIPVGTYYHFAHNLHLYNNIIESKKIW